MVVVRLVLAKGATSGRSSSSILPPGPVSSVSEREVMPLSSSWHATEISNGSRPPRAPAAGSGEALTSGAVVSMVTGEEVTFVHQAAETLEGVLHTVTRPQ